MPDAELLSVERVWNRRLWHALTVNRELVGGAKLLFHGASRQVLCKITGGTLAASTNESGFSTNLGGNGAYSAPGCGCYFAQHAIYPVGIHPKVRENGIYSLIAAEVLCGAVKDYGMQRRPGLKNPPAKPEGGLFDSVSGTEGSIGVDKVPGGCEEFGRQFVIYDNHRAYPHFLLRLRRGRRIVNLLSGRCLFASSGRNWGEGVGAGFPEGDVGADGDWKLLRDRGSGHYRIVNAESGRCLYANSGKNWEDGVGAGYPGEKVGPDGFWQLCRAGGGSWRITNAHTGRCLYAKPGCNWEHGLGAGCPETDVGADGNWKFVPDLLG
mmetsp:Transcript_70075/g.193864  ORF Transcript_70075/g.193864 Transcript_70075/m.193864 type:complete len:324 (-) Transcript_70075:167-1138(-)